MKQCQLPEHSIRMVSCSTCKEISICKKFKNWYHNGENRKKYNNFIITHVSKYPQKYEITGDIMANKKTKAENLILVFEGKTLKKSFPKSKVKNMTQDELMELNDKRLIEATPKELELVFSIKIKSIPWNGKFTKIRKSKETQ